MNKTLLLCGLFFLFTIAVSAQAKTIHVYVALCDNMNQGIVPVPDFLGNGQDPASNLYWGAAYGVKSYFKNKTADWKLIQSPVSTNGQILERLVFKHVSQEVYMLAEAYDGKHIQGCVEDFLKAANGQSPLTVDVGGKELMFGGNADLLAYVGHNGLMDFDVAIPYSAQAADPADVIILGCYSKDYFAPEIKQAGANPILWTTHLMAPEAYTLKNAFEGWIAGENGSQIDERAAQIYNTYQKCGLRGARNLFTTGF